MYKKISFLFIRGLKKYPMFFSFLNKGPFLGIRKCNQKKCFLKPTIDYLCLFFFPSVSESLFKIKSQKNKKKGWLKKYFRI